MRRFLLLLVLSVVTLAGFFETLRACHRRRWRAAHCQPTYCYVQCPCHAQSPPNGANGGVDPADLAEYGKDLQRPSNVPTVPQVPSLQELQRAKPPTSRGPSPATILVQMPAGAKLYFWDQPSQQSGRQRTFTTPVLETGSDYWYEVTASLAFNGGIVTQRQNVTVRAGATVHLTFDFAQATTSLAAR